MSHLEGMMGYMSSVRGKLLVATGAIAYGQFKRSVVFILDHDDEGALGVILNRPLDADVDDVLPQWADWVAAPSCLFDGGPVAVDSALALGVLADDDPPHGWRQMAGRVGIVDLDGPPPTAGRFAGLRVFAGYAGWGPDQLDQEIEDESWIVLPAQYSDLTSPQPEDLWSQVLRRQDSDLRFWATLPDDPSSN